MDGFNISQSLVDSIYPQYQFEDEFNIGAIICDALSLRDQQQIYDRWAPEGFDAGGMICDSLRLAGAGAVTYTGWVAEGTDIGGITCTELNLDEVLIVYTNWPAESIDMSGLTVSNLALT